MPRIFGSTEATWEKGTDFTPRLGENTNAAWTDNAFMSLVLNVEKVEGQEGDLDYLVAIVVEQWLLREPNASRALLAVRLAAERERYLQSLSPLLLEVTLAALSRQS